MNIETVSFEALKELVGVPQEPTDWLTVTQEQINQFGDCTRDNYYIHVDEEKAKKGPFGATIAHGMLTLSMIPYFSYAKSLRIDGTSSLLNYGFDEVRFTNPVKVNSRIRACLTLLSVVEKKPGRYLLKSEVVIEIENETRPALRAVWLGMQL